MSNKCKIISIWDAYENAKHVSILTTKMFVYDHNILQHLLTVIW